MSKNNKGSGDSGGNAPWKRIDASGASDGDIQRVHEELVYDKETPGEGFSPIPIFLVFLISGLIVFAGIYMVHHSGDFNQMTFDETHRDFPWEDAEPALAAVDPAIQAGQRLYGQCAACHQPDGQGLPGAFPPLDSTRWVKGSEERLIRLVAHGLVGPIEVKGDSYNGVMPGFPQFDEEDLAAVLTYIRQAWSNDAPAITPDDVARVLDDVGPRTQPWDSSELLEEFPLEDPAELEDRQESDEG